MSTEAVATTNLPRPPRGTGPSRPRGRGRGGYSAARGALGAAPKATHESSDWAALDDPSSADATEEVAQLKIKYSSQLKSLKEIFPDWTAEDLVYTLQEADGDIELATDRIAGGHATQWGQVKKRSLKDKPKATGRPEGAVSGIRGRGRGAERGAERGSRGRGEGRGSRGRGRGEVRGRGRGAAPVSNDAVSTAATIASDETPSTWPDATSTDETAVADTESKEINGVNGTQTHDEPAPAKLPAWGPKTDTPVAQAQPSPVNGAATQKPAPSASASRQSRIVDPTAKFSWASIVKPAAPPPAAKPAPVPQPPVQPPQERPAPPAQQASSRPSTRGQDVTEEPAQTIHDPFSAAEPAKPKVQLPQPALPYIPSAVSQPKEQLPPSEPLTSRNLDLLEDQRSPVPEPPSTSVAAHRASPAPKSEGPPGLNTRFARNSRDTPVIMPGIAAQPIGAMQLQFGSIDLNQDPEVKAEELKEEPLLPPQPQELEAPQQPTPSQQRASPAAQPPQPVPVQPQSQRIPSIPGQGPPAFQQPAAFGGLIPGQAQRFSGPAAPGLTQSKEFSGFPYEQQYQGQSGSGYGDYLYGAGGQGQYDMSPRDYYYYQQQQQRAPPSSTEQTRPVPPSTTPSNTESATPSQYSSATPASGPASTQPTPTPSTQSQHQPHHPQQYPGMHPYWNPYYSNLYQQHYGGYPYYNQGHKGMYQGQGYGASQYGGQQGGYDRFSARDQSGGYDAFSRGMNYSGGQGQQGTAGQGMQQHGSQHGSQQGQTSNDDTQPTESAPAPSQSSGQGQGQGAGYSGYQGSSQSRLPYGLGPQSGSTGSQQQPQQQGGYQQHYPQNAQQNHGYTGYNPSYNSTGNTNPTSTSQSQTNTQNQRGQSGWGQPYGSH